MIVNLILEGDLEELLAHKLVLQYGHEVGETISLRGASRIKDRSHKYHPMTKRGEAVLVLTDYMDAKEPCVPQARWEYLEKHIRRPSPHFLLRFAVAELESWILADRENISAYLKVPLTRIPARPDKLGDPKRELINLARRSRSNAIRAEIVPDDQHGGAVGPLYTASISRFILSTWDPEKARKNSESLDRCIMALARLG